MYDIKALYEAESVKDAVRLLTEHPDEPVPPSLVQESPISSIEAAADDYDVLGLLSDYL